MGASRLAPSLIYGDLCIYVAELGKLDRLSALVEILSFGEFGARLGISRMTNVIAQYTVLCSQTLYSSAPGPNLTRCRGFVVVAQHF